MDDDEDDYEEQEELEVSLLGMVPITFADEAAEEQSTSISSKVLLRRCEEFRKSFRETRKIKTLNINSFGTFDMRPGMEIQYVCFCQPVPDGLSCSFTMFAESWTSSIRYVLNDKGVTALEFSIRAERTGQVTTIIESNEERHRRSTSRRGALICNKVFDLAWKTLAGKTQSTINIVGTKESATLFGLKDARMKQFVLQWYADQLQLQQG